ncbi:MAG: hypothetical protein Q9191_000038 [Dirinaria sp. TL-2023a]
MLPPFDYLDHRRACQRKQLEREARIANLHPAYREPIDSRDRTILSKPVKELVQDVHKQLLKPIDILRCYGKIAVKAHKKTNCLTEVMLPEAERWAESEINLKGPLAGAIPYVKTNLPITLLSFESTNQLWGRCTNPHNEKYSPGGSTGGEGALLAYGGGRIGIGSDVAGSVRAPAHYSGIYSLRCSTGRWPKMGMNTSMPGQEGIPSVFSPMTRTLEDLVYFSKAMVSMKPWEYDHSVHPIEWRTHQERDAREKPRFKVAVLRSDGVVDPSPACNRALNKAVAVLRAEGHEVVDVDPPSPYEGLVIAANLLNADGCRTFRSFFRTGEWSDTGAAQMNFYMRVPRPIKYLYHLWVKYIRRDPIWAGLLKTFHEKSAFEQWRWVAKREAFKARWHAWWQNEAKVDFLLTPPNAIPAVPHDGMRDAVSNCGYTFLFNLLDYSCGILPVTHVDRALDGLPKGFRLRDLNGVARGAYQHYSADDMHGLPVAVQIVGQRLQEEKVLAIMGRLESALEKHDGKYNLLEIE